MKNFILIILIVLGTFLQINAQCNKATTGFGNNAAVAMYNVTGTVDVVLNSATSVSVNLGVDFATASGPDVRIFLVNRGALTDAQLKIPAMFNARPKIEMGMNPAYLNSYTKTIPAGMNISDFNTVYFYCQQFNQFWDFGSFVPFAASSCSILANNTFERSNFSMYPNPASSELNLENSNDLSVKIYSPTGQIVVEELANASLTRTINISDLTTGIYLLELTNKENNRLIRKFVKQ